MYQVLSGFIVVQQMMNMFDIEFNGEAGVAPAKNLEKNNNKT